MNPNPRFLNMVRQFRAVERATERDYTEQIRAIAQAEAERVIADPSVPDTVDAYEEVFALVQRETGRDVRP